MSINLYEEHQEQDLFPDGRERERHRYSYVKNRWRTKDKRIETIWILYFEENIIE